MLSVTRADIDTMLGVAMPWSGPVVVPEGHRGLMHGDNTFGEAICGVPNVPACDSLERVNCAACLRAWGRYLSNRLDETRNRLAAAEASAATKPKPRTRKVAVQDDAPVHYPSPHDARLAVCERTGKLARRVRGVTCCDCLHQVVRWQRERLGRL
jgi:hypothetical protein